MTILVVKTPKCISALSASELEHPMKMKHEHENTMKREPLLPKKTPKINNIDVFGPIEKVGGAPRVENDEKVTRVGAKSTKTPRQIHPNGDKKGEKWKICFLWEEQTWKKWKVFRQQICIFIFLPR